MPEEGLPHVVSDPHHPNPMRGLLIRIIICLTLFSVSAAGFAIAQPLTFGSAAYPLEWSASAALGGQIRRAEINGGPAFLGTGWNLGLGVLADGAAGRYSGGVGARVHLGLGGFYEPAFDEPYDVLRTIRYARLNPQPTSALYARLGPIRQVRLGKGLLVDAFRTATSIDERTVGLEAAARVGPVMGGIFSSDVRPTTVTGAEISLQLFRTTVGGMPPPQIHGAIVRDFGVGSGGLTGWEIGAEWPLVEWAAVAIVPFAAVAGYLDHGKGLSAGVDLRVPGLIDAALVNVRGGVTVNGNRFIPGYVGPFYLLSNDERRIIEAQAFYSRPDAEDHEHAAVGTMLNEAEGGAALIIEFDALLYGTFEVSSRMARHFGTQTLSRFSFRGAYAGQRGEGLTASLSYHRAGFKGIFAAFSQAGDLNALNLELGYPLAGRLRASALAHYGYRRITDSPLGEQRFLVQRRFEPRIGISYTF
ncbi:hypothetical protein BH23ACT11_BH23ACT11_16930 [soil metagenome]